MPIGLAIHNYASANGGYLSNATITDSGDQVEDRLSWLIEILPYLEAGPGYRTDRKQGW
jgi:hypothetical protein